MRIFFSAGDPSGDQHTAHLISELKRRRPDVECIGYGGPLMEQAGCRLQYQLTDLAVMGFIRVVPLLWRFWKIYRRARHYLHENPPDAVVLVDFPGFNWWIARAAKAVGIPVFYYLPPQLWAWGPWRIKRMRKFVDYVLSAMSFEAAWYADRGIMVEYVGHPFFDEVASARLDPEFCAAWTPRDGQFEEFGAVPPTRNVAMLPGSRNHEVKKNWPVMLQVVRRLHAQHPQARFLVACYKESQLQYCRQQLAADDAGLPIQFFVGKTPEIVELSEMALMVSGSVSLEMLARSTPAVVLYRAGWGMYVWSKLLITCRYFSLPNLMADCELFPEFASVGDPRADVEQMTAILDCWLRDPDKLRAVTTELHELREQQICTGATARAAAAILERLPAASTVKAA